jgi:hypothetical protein
MSTQKNTQDISVKMAALEQRLSALESREEAHFAEVSQSIAELKAEPPAKAKSGGSKAKKPKPEGGEAEAESKKPNAWALFVGQTVAEMKQSGWETFQNAEGVVWPASRREGEQYVYDGGEHDGKPASHSRGGMVHASYLRAQNNPEAESKRKAYRTALAEKRSDPPAMVGGGGGSIPSDAESGSLQPKKAGRPKMTEEQKAAAAAARAEKRSTGSTPSDAESGSVGLEPKKAGRPKMTEEQKAAAKAKRAAKKAEAEGLNLKGEWAEMEAH